MSTMVKLALAVTVAVGAATAVQAGGSKNDGPRGGSDIGPLGQCFDQKVCSRGYHKHFRRTDDFAYAPGLRYRRHLKD